MLVDMILTDAKVLTMDPLQPRATAVAVAGGRIVAVGGAEVAALAGSGTRLVRCGGRTLLPGFVESHMHLFGGVELQHLQLTGVTGMAALRAAFAGFAAANPDAPVLMAEGVEYGILGHPVTRADLDAVLADRPIALRAMDHHTVWCNTLCLERAGLLHGAAMPPGHEVVIGPDGLASGELREFEAFDPVLALAGVARMYLGIAKGAEPAGLVSVAERAVDNAHIARGMQHCAERGITTLVSMDGNRYTLELLAEMEAAGRLLQRVKVPFHMKPDMALDELDRASAMAADFQGEWVQSGFVKMFMDGVIDSRTAYMLQDYPGMPGHRSEPLFGAERFKDICTEIDRRGLQIAVHAIGDGAVRVTIDGYEAARLRNGPRDARHRIEHIELIDRADVPRLGALAITASLQPPHAPGAMDFPLEGMEAVVADHRLPDAFLCKTLVDSGASLAFASDWPVTDVSVMRGIQAALTRVPYAGAQDERVGLMAALRAYTAGGAWAAHLEGLTGMLRVGLAADLVLIDGDIEALPATRIGQTAVALTVCGGKTTHAAGGFVG
ncbi:amidohydrolase [Tabrizicola sp.]|uniref:amidohydrolase n=1 Tax=Tabrizicola sp. TaxID=2005166 RepID=UPI00286A874E|nr:amidohydrolase [Tabrizicola sp.]